MEDAPLTHSQIFANQVLPQLFHGAPAQLWQYLNRDGTQFLNFYWDAAGEKLHRGARASSFGLNFTVEEPAPRMYAAVITLPEPKIAGEAYYAALIYRPDRRILLVSDMTRVFTLERTDPAAEGGQPGTRLVQWTTHLVRVDYSVVVERRQSAFLAAVLAHLDD
ncbi:MAG: hypothetical protein ACYC3P_09075 [Bellilinea sp.]